MKKISLYLSAFIPLYVLVIIRILIDIINHNLSFNFLNTTTLIILSILIAVGINGAVVSVSHLDSKEVQIKVIKKTSITEQYFLGYFSLFVLFALTFELEKVSMFVVFTIVILLIGIVYVKNDLFYINPFLNILGYNFYDIKYIVLDDKSKKIRQAKFFYKGKLDLSKKCYSAYLSHENFSMITKKCDWVAFFTFLVLSLLV